MRPASALSLLAAGLMTVVTGCESRPSSRWVRIAGTGDLVIDVDTQAVQRHNGSLTAWLRLYAGQRTSDGKPLYHFERLEFDCPGLRSRLVDTARANGDDFTEITGRKLDSTVTAWQAYPANSDAGRAARETCRRLTPR
jgi:hypothetical protein